MATEVGRAFVPVTFDKNQIGRDLSSSIEQGGRQAQGAVKSSFGKLATVAVGAFSAVAVGSFFKGTIDAASDLNESMSKVNVVFGDNAKEIQDWSKTSATALGQSKQGALEAAGSFGNLFTALKLGPRETTDMSKSLVGLASDLASFNNVSPEEALLALRSGLVGETEPLRKFGVNMNDATLRAEALKLGLISNVKDALTPAVKAQAAYGLIMEQTTTAQGDFARTSDGLANKQRILAARFSDIKARIGTALLPVVLKIADVFSKNLGPAMDWLGHMGRTLSLGVQALVAAFREGDVTSDGFVGKMELLGVKLRRLWDLAQPFVNWVKANWKPILIAAGVAVGLIVVPLATLAAGVVYAYTRFSGFREVIAGVVAWLVRNVPPTFATIRDVIEKVARFVKDNAVPVIAGLGAMVAVVVVPAFVSWAIAAGTAAVAMVTLWGPIILLIAAVGLVVAGVVYAYQHFEIFRDIVNTVTGTIVAVLKAGWESITSLFEGAFDIILGFWHVFIGIFTGDWSQAWEGVKQIVSGVWEAITGTIGGQLDMVIAIFKGAIELIILIWQAAHDAIFGKDANLNVPMGDTTGAPGLAEMLANVAGPAPIYAPPRFRPVGTAAGGGIFGTGDWSWVGEDGPELVHFRAPATVIPTGDSLKMLGQAGGNTYQLSSGPVYVNDGEDVRVAFRRLELLAGVG